jgi:hypothetical protein
VLDALRRCNLVLLHPRFSANAHGDGAALVRSAICLEERPRVTVWRTDINHRPHGAIKSANTEETPVTSRYNRRPIR